jgi:hypothetical protein
VLLRDPQFENEIHNLRKIVIKYYLEEYFEIDVQIKVIDVEFLIQSIWLDSPMLSPIFFYTILNSKSQNSF